MIIETKSAKETYDLGKKIGSHAKAGEVYTLVKPFPEPFTP